MFNVGKMILLVIVLGLLSAIPIMFLWNTCFVPAVTFANKIDWLQAWGIMIMIGLLGSTPISLSAK